MRTPSSPDIAADIQRKLGTIKSGSLRLWGVWLGRPYDNFHTVIRVEMQSKWLALAFEEGEVLQIWNPIRYAADEHTFVIEQADRVRWEWFSYGEPGTPENLCFMDFAREGAGIVLSTMGWSAPDQQPDPNAAAVEIL